MKHKFTGRWPVNVRTDPRIAERKISDTALYMGDFEIEVDLDEVLRQMAHKAANNKSNRAVEIRGGVTVATVKLHKMEE